MEASVHLLAVVVGGVVHRQADLAAHHVGFHEVAPGGADALAQGQQGRENGDGGMAEAAEVVVVQGVAHGSVDQGGVEGGSAVARRQYRGFLGAAQFAGVAPDDVAQLLGRAGQDDAHQVKAGLVGHANGVRRDVLIRSVHNPLCYLFRRAHGARPP